MRGGVWGPVTWSGTNLPQSFNVPQVPFTIGAFTIYNNSPITYTLSQDAGGKQVLAVIPPYYSQSAPITPSYSVFIQGDGTTPDALSTLSLQLFEAGSPGGPLAQFSAITPVSFIRPVTLSLAGGIYQGTGTFAAPISGMKIWNNAGLGEIDFYSGGVPVVTLSPAGLVFVLFPLTEAGVTWDSTSFRGPGLTLDATGLTIGDATGDQLTATAGGLSIVGGSGAVKIDSSGLKTYNGATLECSIGTDGKLTAIGGNLTVDSTGIAITPSAVAYALGNAYHFEYSGGDQGGVYAIATSTVGKVALQVNPVGTQTSVVVEILANGLSSGPANLNVQASDSTFGITGLTLDSAGQSISLKTGGVSTASLDASGNWLATGTVRGASLQALSSSHGWTIQIEGSNTVVRSLAGANPLVFVCDDLGELSIQAPKLGFYATSAISKPTVTGSKAGNAALGSLMTALANLGLVTNSTT